MPRLSDYGLSKDDYALLLEWQDDACWACYRKFTRRRPACVDHDHRTGKVRGLLCQRCNGLLGLVHDSFLVLDGLAQFLAQPPAYNVFDSPRFHKDAPPHE